LCTAVPETSKTQDLCLEETKQEQMANSTAGIKILQQIIIQAWLPWSAASVAQIRFAGPSGLSLGHALAAGTLGIDLG